MSFSENGFRDREAAKNLGLRIDKPIAMEQSVLQRAAAGRAILPAAAQILPPLAVFAPLGAAPLLSIAALAAVVFDGPRLAISMFKYFAEKRSDILPIRRGDFS